jgi:hypothetical protein
LHKIALANDQEKIKKESLSDYKKQYTEFSNGYLRGALKALDFGDIIIELPRSNPHSIPLPGNKTIQVDSLSDLVTAIMLIKLYSPDPMVDLKGEAREMRMLFGLILLNYLAKGIEPKLRISPPTKTSVLPAHDPMYDRIAQENASKS